VWVGIDLGTQGVRALAVTAEGRVAGRGAAPLSGRRDGVRHEQHPADWWHAVVRATRAALTGLPPAAVRGLAVCGTSGTVVLTDRQTGEPISEGLMYDDGRAPDEARRAGEALGRRIQPSWALAKALWLARTRPRDLARARIAHQADLVVSRLVGRPSAGTDSSHALKTGYDLAAEAWPFEAFERLGLPVSLFPEVARPGTVLGRVGAEAAAATGVGAGTPVVAGMTDGCAAQLGSGALRLGWWNASLGTTLVLKGVTAEPVQDPDGVMYSHRAPDGRWLPGGASSVGAGALTTGDRADLARLDALASRYEPSSAVAYPLVSPGERFPFLAPRAEAFWLGTPADEGDRHAALLQGVALTERLALAYVRRLGAPVEGPLTFTGGAARSDYWCQLRADVLGRPARVPAHADATLGMAVLAAYGTQDGGDRAGLADLADLAASMVHIRRVVEPRPHVTERFAEPYHRLLDELTGRGWLPADVAAYAREQG
jgi:sugar (pentulose or hexulose) kinase